MDKKNSARAKHIDFIILDIVAIELAFLLSCTIFYERVHNWLSIYRNIDILIVVLYIIIMMFNPYHRSILKRGYLKEIWRVIVVNTELMLALLAILFMLKESATYSRVVLGSFAIFDTVFMFVIRSIWKKVLHRRFRKGKENSNVLILSGREGLSDLITALEKNNSGYYIYKGIVLLGNDKGSSPDEKDAFNNIPVIPQDGILDYVKENAVNEVYIAAGRGESDYLSNQFLNMGITVHVILDYEIMNLQNVSMTKLGDYSILTTSIGRATVGELLVKRIADIIISLIGLIFTGILTVFLAPVIKMQAPGPVFFAQKRVGKNGKIFKMYKFRSMYTDAEERKKELMDQNEMQGLMFKMENDPRIFPAGNFMRKTSIDEFPQFLNILKGDMSLVGTRPPTLDEYEKYDQHHLSRLAMKPGLTGMWQTSGRSDITDFEEIVKLDNFYIRNFSLGLDVKIIIKTFGAVLLRKGSK